MTEHSELDLNSLSLASLKELRKKVDKAIEGYDARVKGAMISEVESIAKKYGFSFGDLAAEIESRKRPSIEPKYANPDNPAETWSGRGRKPNWVSAALDSGKTLGDLRIG